MAGWPVTYGSSACPDGPSEMDELVVAALRRAGFVLAGRTNVPELGPLPVAENLRYGVTRNPWDPARTPGGSSGGAAAAVAAGMFPAGPWQRRRRVAADPRLVHRPGRAEGQPGPGAGLRAGVDGRRGRGRAHPHRGRRRGGPRRDLRARPARLVQRPGPRPPFADEVGADPGPLRVALSVRAPLGLPVDAAATEAVHRTRRPARVARPRGARDRSSTSSPTRPGRLPRRYARRPGRLPRIDVAGSSPTTGPSSRRASALSSIEFVGRPRATSSRATRRVVARSGRGFRRPGHPHHGHPAPRGRHGPRAGRTRTRPASRPTCCRWPPSPRRST